MSGVLTFAKKLATLSPEDFKNAVAFAQELSKNGPIRLKSGPRKKRKYTRKAKAVEVAPGVKVVKGGRKKRSSSDEVDHSPRSVEEQVR